MIVGDIVGLSLRNLRQSKLRTALTTLGVSIGIASLAGMVSLGVGLQDQVVGRFLQSGVFDAVTIVSPSLLGVPGALLAGRGGLRGGLRGRGGLPGNPQSSSPQLNDDALKQISALENVREVYPNFRVPVEIRFGDFSRPITVGSVTMSSKGERPFQTLSYGQFFTSESHRACMYTSHLPDRSVGHWHIGGLRGNRARLGCGTGHQLWSQRVHSKPGWNTRHALLAAAVADRERDRVFHSGESRRRKLSGFTRSPARSHSGTAARLVTFIFRPAALRTFLESQRRHSAWKPLRNQRTEISALRARIQQPGSNKRHQVFEFFRRKMWRVHE